jgi:hypothetical protein
MTQSALRLNDFFRNPRVAEAANLGLEGVTALRLEVGRKPRESYFLVGLFFRFVPAILFSSFSLID